jgi:hypothetical protein
MKRLNAKVNRGAERMIAVAQHHAANTEHRAANTMQPITARRKGGGRIQSVLPTPIGDDCRLVKAAGGFLNVAIIAPA